ncbi:MAG: hypothetical protein B6D46_16065 [Polyangiaceae bacterium UTPRO1]|nr:MAG: hypothetical protein B6D46_16065 [Polyangiaceae bacterium UTPRO1]
MLSSGSAWHGAPQDTNPSAAGRLAMPSHFFCAAAASLPSALVTAACAFGLSAATPLQSLLGG